MYGTNFLLSNHRAVTGSKLPVHKHQSCDLTENFKVKYQIKQTIYLELIGLRPEGPNFNARNN